MPGNISLVPYAGTFKLTLHHQKSAYSIYGKPHSIPFQQPCSGGPICDMFAYTPQEKLEEPPAITAAHDGKAVPITISGLVAGTYKLLSYNLLGCCISTVRGIVVENDKTTNVSVRRSFDKSRSSSTTLPSSCFLDGDIVRQHQQATPNCGPFSVALAASYWNPMSYNPMANNGYEIFLRIDNDLIPGAFCAQISGGLAKLGGFSTKSYKLNMGAATRDASLKKLKRWIHAGAPVIVGVDEGIGVGGLSNQAEHYKVIVGYDDNKSLEYIKDDGKLGSSTGAFYFINSGARGTLEGSVSALPGTGGTVFPVAPANLKPTLRESAPSYQKVPIGDDVDSYIVFWEKWKTAGNGLGAFDPLWYLPVYPTMPKMYVPK